MRRSLLSTSGLARTSASYPWRTLGLWLIVIVVAGFLAAGMSESGSSDGDFTNTPDSKRAAQLVDQRLDGETPLSETIVIQSQTTTVDDPAF